MCDTFVALGPATREGGTLFGKNSDREPNEAQNLCHVPAQTHGPGAVVTCTYITIPQAEKTHAALLCRPFWMWGAEMGVNAHGLAVGNEAVFTRVPYDKGRALTGMDLVRLALERAATAREAVTVITELLAAHGQGGNCGYTGNLFYHNSFLMADPDSAWVLETAGPHWAAKKVTGCYAISNCLTIDDTWDLASDGLVDFAIKKGWCKSGKSFSFARAYSDFLYTRFSGAACRRSRAMALLEARKGDLSVQDCFAILRDHGEAENFCPDQGFFSSQVCNHAAWGPVRISQTTGSLVSRLATGSPVHFVTGTAAPCTGLFKPIWVDTPVQPGPGLMPAGKHFDPDTLFWSHERIHRRVIRNYSQHIQRIIPARDATEQALTALALGAGNRAERQAVVDQAFAQGAAAVAQSLAAMAGTPRDAGRLYSWAWKRRNQGAGLSDSDMGGQRF